MSDDNYALSPICGISYLMRFFIPFDTKVSVLHASSGMFQDASRKGTLNLGLCNIAKRNAVHILVSIILLNHMATVSREHEPYLMALFGYKFEKNTPLYRCADKEIDIGKKGTAWYSLDIDEASTGKYGNYIYTFKTSKPLKLINLSSILFRQHFLDQVNLRFAGKENQDDDELLYKVCTLLSAGIPDFETQIDVVKKYVNTLNPPALPCTFSEVNQPNINSKLQFLGRYFGGHRYSDMNVDKCLATLLEEIYGNIFHGYIVPMKWPSCWHRFFPPEVCLFNAVDNTRFIKLTKHTFKTQSAGSPPPEDDVDYKALARKMQDNDFSEVEDVIARSEAKRDADIAEKKRWQNMSFEELNHELLKRGIELEVIKEGSIEGGRKGNKSAKDTKKATTKGRVTKNDKPSQK